MTDKPHGMTGQKNALKNETLDSKVFFRCLSKDKGAWVRVANKEKLNVWIIKTLNEAAKKQ